MAENTLNEVANSLTDLNAVLEKAKDDVAEAVAKESLGRLNLTIHDGKKLAEMTDEDRQLAGINLEPISSDAYLDGLCTAAVWRALRAELPAAIVRVNNVAVDRSTLASREGNFRSDTEAANAERTLAFYEVLDERLDRVETGLTHFFAMHQLAVDVQRHDDDVRQNDVPQAERRYVRMPSLRWIRNADREIEGIESTDDFNQLKIRARSYLDATQSNQRRSC